MLKSDLVENICSAYPSRHRAPLEQVVDTIIDEIAKCLEAGGRVELRNFGVFSVKVHPARLGRNSKTGEIIQVQETAFVKFKPGRQTNDQLNKR